MELVQPGFRNFLEDIYRWCKLGLLFLITVSIRRISVEKRIKWARVVRRIFEVLFTYYRMSRMLFFLICNFVNRKLTISIRRMHKYGLKQHSESEEGTSRWSTELPEDIMLMILQRLCISDFFRCCAVCVSWKATVDQAVASKIFHPAPELPWLMLRSHPFSVKDNCFLRLNDDRKLFPKASPTYNMNRGDCLGSIEGWLIMADSALWRPEGFMKPWSFYLCNHESSSFRIDYFFLNPLSGARVMLPSTKNTLPCHCMNEPSFCMIKVAASSVPTSQHCFVASLCVEGHLAFCRPSDKLWTLIDQMELSRQHSFRDIEIIDGKIYAASWEAYKYLMVYDIQYGNGLPRYSAEKLVMLHPGPVHNMLHQVRSKDGVEYHTNADFTSLAKDCFSGELFMIYCTMNYALEENPMFPWSVFVGCDFVIPLKAQAFRVFKMERNINGPQWAEVFDLGDRILFVSMSGNKIIPVSNGVDYNGVTDEAYKRNCIYFAYDTHCFASPSTGRDVGLFSLTDRKITHIEFANKRFLSKLNSRPVWFSPNPW